jgi:hypothetical protein
VDFVPRGSLDACALAADVDLVVHDQSHGAFGAIAQQGGIGLGASTVGDENGNVGAGQFGARAAHAFAFDQVARLAQAGRVDQGQYDAVDVDAFAQQVARRAGNRRDDRAIALRQRIEQTRLAGVRPADDDDMQAVAQHDAAASAASSSASCTCSAARSAVSCGALRKSISSRENPAPPRATRAGARAHPAACALRARSRLRDCARPRARRPRNRSQSGRRRLPPGPGRACR